MMIPKISMVFSVFGLSGLSFVSSIYSGGAKVEQKSRLKMPKREWPKDYEQTCYKWIFYGSSKTKGELAACLDKTAPNSSSSSLIFVLWWTENNSSRFLAVESINVVGKQISFKFSHPNRTKGMEGKKLDIPPKHPYLNNNLENLNKLNDQKLEDICSLQGTKLVCSSAGYEAETRQITWLF